MLFINDVHAFATEISHMCSLPIRMLLPECLLPSKKKNKTINKENAGTPACHSVASFSERCNEWEIEGPAYAYRGVTISQHLFYLKQALPSSRVYGYCRWSPVNVCPAATSHHTSPLIFTDYRLVAITHLHLYSQGQRKERSKGTHSHPATL